MHSSWGKINKWLYVVMLFQKLCTLPAVLYNIAAQFIPNCAHPYHAPNLTCIENIFGIAIERTHDIINTPLSVLPLHCRDCASVHKLYCGYCIFREELDPSNSGSVPGFPLASQLFTRRNALRPGVFQGGNQIFSTKKKGSVRIHAVLLKQ